MKVSDTFDLIDIQERLFVLFEHGNVSATEFRVLHELKSSFNMTTLQMAETMKTLGLSLGTSSTGRCKI